jgi:outer membrane protein OmpA-like peptidoglycan-associated protein
MANRLSVKLHPRPAKLRLHGIDITGHADRSGSARYNDRLSRRRANAVKRGLISNGVPEKDIIIYAHGEREPLVPTRDGVREPQNRRVEIALN